MCLYAVGLRVEFLPLRLSFHRHRAAVNVRRPPAFLKGDTAGPPEVDDVTDEGKRGQDPQHLQEETRRKAC